MNTETEMAILALAIEAEKESLRQYLNFAWQTKDTSGKNMFIRLALDEYHHWQVLEENVCALQKLREWANFTPFYSGLEQLVPKLSDKSIRIKGSDGQNELSALQTALELENSARNFYLQQAATVQSHSAQNLFRRLAEIEQTHIEIIQAEIDSILKTGFWFGLPEFSMEGNP